jgi:hypothetical protein
VKSFSSSSIPKILGIFALLSSLVIFLLFFSPRQPSISVGQLSQNEQELFNRIIAKGMPEVKKLWEQGKLLFPKHKFECPEEVVHKKNVGVSYYQCQPHFWQCYWTQGILEKPEIPVKIDEVTYHLQAMPSFAPQEIFSKRNRYYQIERLNSSELSTKFGMKIELKVKEIENLTQISILFDTCRDTYLPQRVYPYGHQSDEDKEEWDNFYRHIFVDKFYVSNEKVNQWRLLTSKSELVIKDREKWFMPAILDLNEQIQYCSFWGKRLMEAKIFDAASMTPGDMNNPESNYLLRPHTFWQRDIKKTFLYLMRENPDYELTPLDCDLVQVAGCKESYFSTDSSTWIGMNYSQGFYAESLWNSISPDKNLKPSSRDLSASSLLHELGKKSTWDGTQKEDRPVAFRCYEEVE